MSREIVINGRFLTQPVTGVQRYARELLLALERLIEAEGLLPAERFRIRIAVPAAWRGDSPFARLPLARGGAGRGHLWEQLALPAIARGALLVGLGNTGPLLGGRQIVTIHDAGVFACPDSYSWRFRAWYRLLYRRVGARADAVITPSAFSRDELVRRVGIAPDRITIVPNGVDHLRRVVPDERAVSAHGLSAGSYVLCIGNRAPHKNVGVLVRAMAQVRTGLRLVIAGGRFDRVFGADRLALPSDALHLGYVSDNTLKALYARAACFVFPSRYEGFGLPPLEAMAAGCPVIASDAAALPEVCGDAALYFDPDRPEALAAQIERVAGDAALQADLRRRGALRSAGFTWERSARGLAALLIRASAP
ncbi:MAG: glycosyltransferase family 4 protein [Candidatus Lambdaproteobacteria bacterium]|nr:glycosyltransferase family 4 protein [Candidatus Lambdaproteobacteria bacterium]